MGSSSSILAARAEHRALARQNRHHSPGAKSPFPSQARAAAGLTTFSPHSRRASTVVSHSRTPPALGWTMERCTSRMVSP